MSDVVFVTQMKSFNTYFLIVLLPGNLDTIMECSSKKKKKTATQVSMSIFRDLSYGDFCQP
ncbi:hypothetical protein U9M48_018680 [Paspalum notatum var. saurae]|uniref:Uncharacterized protein n=1 Tax=Paspalum notatum var. saurae TaxID=547442 RepID=A0AAQ3TAM7_PASNO